jgi:hypothetical protein
MKQEAGFARLVVYVTRGDAIFVIEGDVPDATCCRTGTLH